MHFLLMTNIHVFEKRIMKKFYFQDKENILMVKLQTCIDLVDFGFVVLKSREQKERNLQFL